MLGRLQDEYAPKGLEVLAIDIFGSPADEWIGFWRSSNGRNVTWGVAPDGSLVRNYDVTILGQTAIIDRGGGIVYNGPPLDGYLPLKVLIEQAL